MHGSVGGGIVPTSCSHMRGSIVNHNNQDFFMRGVCSDERGERSK